MKPAIMIRASSSALRELSPSALALWKALVRARREAGSEWFHGELDDLRSRARIRSYSTATAALAQLREAALVATSRTAESRWARVGDRIESVQAVGENMYFVAGDYATRAGVDLVTLPEDRGAEVARALSARDRGYPLYEVVDQGSRIDNKGLDPKSCMSVIYSIYNTDSSEASEKSPLRGDHSIDPEKAASWASDDDDPDQPGEHESISIGSAPRLPGGRGRCPYLPPDHHAAPAPRVSYVSPDMVPEQKAVEVIDGYRRAVRVVYGVEWWHYSKGDVRRAKGYDKLVACGDALAERSVPAEHWAIWRLRYLKEKSGRFSAAPPPILVVMSAKTVSERGGWFRKDYELPVPILQPDPVIAEQHLRNREAARRWRGLAGDAVFYFAFPEWYVEKRRVEIAAGVEDPHEMWPIKTGSRYGKST